MIKSDKMSQILNLIALDAHYGVMPRGHVSPREECDLDSAH